MTSSNHTGLQSISLLVKDLGARKSFLAPFPDLSPKAEALRALAEIKSSFLIILAIN